MFNFNNSQPDNIDNDSSQENNSQNSILNTFNGIDKIFEGISLIGNDFENNNSSFQPIINNSSVNDEGLERPTNFKTNEEENKGNKKELFVSERNDTNIMDHKGNDNHKLGRKKKADKRKGAHNRFSDDNLRRKVKHIVLKYVLEFLNAEISKYYNGDIGTGFLRKELLPFGKEQKSNATINYNKQFLSKNLGDIFSEPVSTKFTNYERNHNELLIKKLMNEENDYFKELFNLTFLDSLKHFRGSKSCKPLNGLKTFDQIQEIEFKDIIYLIQFKRYMNKFEEIISRKKSRASKKKINEI